MPFKQLLLISMLCVGTGSMLQAQSTEVAAQQEDDCLDDPNTPDVNEAENEECLAAIPAGATNFAPIAAGLAPLAAGLLAGGGGGGGGTTGTTSTTGTIGN
ncbi:hypothetical protein [Aestuariibius sp. HNIBRBA575]|uniref:hypothetical protein n=1 Tax=Aestuariibius sp. HNIBRBA575 TaxID=3233343 RepID=UPI0034A2C038